MQTAELYRDSLLLSHLARSIASEACAVDPSCNVDWSSLAKYGDDATIGLFQSTWQDVTTHLRRPDLAAKSLRALTPWDAATEAWNVTGTLTTQDGHHVVATPAGTDPLVEAFFAQGEKRRSSWRFLAGSTLAVLASLGIAIAVASRRG